MRPAGWTRQTDGMQPRMLRAKSFQFKRAPEGTRYAKVTFFFTLLKDTVQINHLDKRTSRATYQHIYMHVLAGFATA